MHRERGLTVAFEVTNLNSHGKLALVTAMPVGPLLGLRLVTVRAGALPCGATSSRTAAQLGSGGRLVVALDFHRDLDCPRTGLLAAQVTFRTETGGIVHADATDIADLRSVAFAGC